MRIDRRIAAGLFFGFVGFYLLTTGATRPYGDGLYQHMLARQLWAQGRLDLDLQPGRWLFEGPDGKHYTTFSLGIAVAMGPSVGAVDHFARGYRPEDRWAIAHRAANILYGALAVALFFLLCRQLAINRRPALFAALCLGLATQHWVYAHSDFSESYQTLALLLAVMATVYARDDQKAAPWLLGIAWGQLFLAKVVYYALVPVAFGYLAWRWRGRRPAFARMLGKALVAVAPFIALALWYNWLRSGSLLGTGRQMDHFAGPMAGDWWVGLHGLLFSSGKGVLWFNPILIASALGLAAFVRRRGAEAWFVLGVAATLVLVYGKYVFWHGAWSFGPRFLTCLMPLLVLPLLDSPLLAPGRVRRLALAALCVISVGVQLLGNAVYEGHHIHVNNAARRALLGEGPRDDCGHCHENAYPTHFVPQFNAIAVHAWLVRRHIHDWDDATARREAPWATYFPDELLQTVELKPREIDFWLAQPIARTPTGQALVAVSALLMLLGLGMVDRGLRRARAARAPPREDPTM